MFVVGCTKTTGGDFTAIPIILCLDPGRITSRRKAIRLKGKTQELQISTNYTYWLLHYSYVY